MCVDAMIHMCNDVCEERCRDARCLRVTLQRGHTPQGLGALLAGNFFNSNTFRDKYGIGATCLVRRIMCVLTAEATKEVDMQRRAWYDLTTNDTVD